ncbi:MAG: VCBS repeat-containing protein [Balneolaceae bacterium]|nr:VCBS repeat-containing protein [Balneolaceae bacterium]
MEGQVGQGNDLTVQITFLRNRLNQMSEFQSDLASVRIPPNEIGTPILDFTWLPEPVKQMAEKDDQLTFSIETLAEGSGFELVKPVSLSEEQLADWISVKSGTAFLNGERELDFPGQVNSQHAVTGIDYNYDFLNDLAFAGDNGFKLYRQQDDGTFEEVRGTLNLPQRQLNRSYQALWSRDIDLDGDLDLVLSPTNGAVTVFRNNGDGTFDISDVFGSVSNLVGFAWADLDRDADSDAILLTDDGSVHFMENQRSGAFAEAEGVY